MVILGAVAPISTVPASAADPLPTLVVNEVDATGTPGDWIELKNTGTVDVNAGGLILKDDKDADKYVIAADTIIPAGGYASFDVAATFGLGAKGDAARLYLSDNTTLIDGFTWTSDSTATLSWGRCPDGTGAFAVTTAKTRDTSNACATSTATPTASATPSATPTVVPTTAPSTIPVVINEIDASGDPGDWIELKNTSTAAVDISGLILQDETVKSYTIPAGTTIAASGYVSFDVSASFGLGKSADSARLFQSDDTTVIDSFSWTADSAPSTWGRCPDGTGAFAVTASKTRDTANICSTSTTPPTTTPTTAPTVPTALAWPGSPDVTTANVQNYFGTNMSGLAYQLGTNGAADTLWAVKNGPSTLYRLQKSGTNWVPVTTDGWADGKALHYPDGTGDPDTEGMVYTPDAVYASVERNNSNSGVSRPAIMRFDTTTTGTSINASIEWNLTADLPVVGANLGPEGVALVPDAALVSKNFVDETTGKAYDPSRYPNHGTGLFFVGLEGTGSIYVYALDQTDGSKFTRIATISSGFPTVMEVQWDAEKSALWAVCDNTCGGQFALLDVAKTGANAGHFAVTTVYNRPASMGNFNNEGFVTAPQALCVNGVKPVFWADDDQDAGYSLRQGTIDCVAAVTSTPTPTPAPTATPLPAKALRVTVAGALHATGATITVTGKGLAPKERFHVRLLGETVYTGTANADGVGTARVSLASTVPEGKRTFQLVGVTANRSGLGTTYVVSKSKALKVGLSRASVTSGNTFTIAVKGLAPGEPVVVTFGGKRVSVATAHASGSGSFAIKVKTPSTSRGTVAVAARGLVPTRTGATTISVRHR